MTADSPTPPQQSGDDELRKQVHELFGDSQLEDGGYFVLYDGKWLDMTNEVCSVVDYITARDASIRIDELNRLNTRRHYGLDYQDSLDALDEYKDQRIVALNKGDS